MKKFLKQLFCRHKFKYTKLDELIRDEQGKTFKKTFCECVYCGKIRTGKIHVND